MSGQIALKSRLAVLGLATATLLLAACEHPPVSSEQRGFRGVAIQQERNPRAVEALQAVNVVPESQPPADHEGPLAKDVYQNVQVLGDLTVPEFVRVMTSITSWVAPEQGCAYCHSADGLAADTLYTKVVARRMLQMTRHLNTDWTAHVQGTGVTCYTCHRGQSVPAYVWYKTPDHSGAIGEAARDQGKNSPVMAVGLTSLQYDPFSHYLDDPAGEIHVQSYDALPKAGDHGRSIKAAEATYGLMMHVSQALGVNCTYCHNSRAFESWEQSSPQRVRAWYGIRMVRDLNAHYLDTLKGTFPAKRLGPLGDVPKVNCTTCHQGVFKPLYGVSMFKDYPELGAAREPPPAPEPPAKPGKAIRKAS